MKYKNWQCDYEITFRTPKIQAFFENFLKLNIQWRRERNLSNKILRDTSVQIISVFIMTRIEYKNWQRDYEVTLWTRKIQICIDNFLKWKIQLRKERIVKRKLKIFLNLSKKIARGTSVQIINVFTTTRMKYKNWQRDCKVTLWTRKISTFFENILKLKIQLQWERNLFKKRKYMVIPHCG